MSFGKRHIPCNAPQVDWQANDAVTTRIVATNSWRKTRHYLAQVADDNNTLFVRIKRWLNSEAF